MAAQIVGNARNAPGWTFEVAAAPAVEEETAPAEETIVSIDLHCAAAIDSDGLMRMIPLRLGAVVRPENLEEAKRHLQLTELFTSITLETRSVPGGVAIDVWLVRKPVINAIRFRGGGTFGADALRRVIRLQEGSPVNDALRDYAATRLVEHYKEQGFPSVQVQTHMQSLVAGEVDITFEIEEGPPLLVAAITFRGDTSALPPDRLRQAISFAEGSRYSKEGIHGAEKSIRRLFREHSYFEAEIEADWVILEQHSGRLEVEIRSGPAFEIIFSGNQYFGDAAILEMMDLLERPIITDGTWRELGRRTRRAYQAAGFYDARVTTRTTQTATRSVLFDVAEGPRRHLGAVRFEGNRGLGDEQLREAMATQPPSWWPWNAGVLIDDVLDDDLKRLWFLYRRYGFTDAQIVDARREVDEASGAILVVVVIEEGEQTVVGAVERIGFEPLGADLPKGVEPQQPFDAEAVEGERRQLATALFKAGYSHAQVDAKVRVLDSEGGVRRVGVRFETQPGQPQTVGDVFVQNNIDTRAHVILRELPFRKGDRLNPDALLAGQSNIYKLGLFRTVSVRPLVEGAASAADLGPQRDIVVNVSERFPGSLQWGFGYNTRDGIRGFAEVGYTNLQGQARRVSLRGDFNFDPSNVEPDEYLGNLGFLEPRLADTRWTARLNLIAQQASRAVDEFSVKRVAFVPAIERPIFRGLTVGVDAQIEKASISDVARDVLVFNPRDEGDLVTVGGGPYAVYDGRDDPFQPTRGEFASIRVRVAPAQLGSDIPFVKVVGQHSHYFPITDNVTIVYAGRVGWGYTLDGGDVLPIRERFFLGGRTTVRGFSENSIGPEGAPIFEEDGSIAHKGGNPLGGDLLASANLELRFPIAFGLGGATFVDGGALYLQERPILIEDVRESAGFGLRYATPVGPIGLDYGVKLDRRRGESVGEIHFSIGTIF